MRFKQSNQAWTSKRAVKALALAEPANAASGRRLIVDASSTILVDHKSGIQRVVKKICGNLFGQAQRAKFGNRAVMTFCDGPDGWYDAFGNVERLPDKKSAPRIVPEAGDTILMLDSSWQFQASHRPFFLSARLRHAEIVSCLYDLVPLKVPAFCGSGMPIAFADWFQTALVFSTSFVCISKAIADELHEMLEAIQYPHAMKIAYWPLGADFADNDTPERAKDPVLHRADEETTFLMVGTLEPRKGHRIALDAFSKLWTRGIDAKLVFVGKVGWGSEPFVRRLRTHEEFGKRLLWHEAVDDTALVGLYRDADALIAASYAEGFGLPIVEAGHFGKPVIASDIAVFREVSVGAQSADFFPVGNSDGLAEKVEAFINRRSSAAIEKGELPVHDRMKPWPTWKESAEALERLLVEDRWYKHYEPRTPRPFSSITDIGATRMEAPLSPQDKHYRLELIEAPVVNSGSDGDVGVTVALTNLSQSVWSSIAKSGREHTIIVATRPIVANGACDADPMDTSAIPFVLIPGDTLYLYISVASVLRGKSGGDINIAPFQVGSGWMPDGIDIPRDLLK